MQLLKWKKGLTLLTTLWTFSNPLKAKSKSSMVLSLWNSIFDLLVENEEYDRYELQLFEVRMLASLK